MKDMREVEYDLTKADDVDTDLDTAVDTDDVINPILSRGDEVSKNSGPVLNPHYESVVMQAPAKDSKDRRIEELEQENAELRNENEFLRNDLMKYQNRMDKLNVELKNISITIKYTN